MATSPHSRSSALLIPDSSHLGCPIDATTNKNNHSNGRQKHIGKCGLILDFETGPISLDAEPNDSERIEEEEERNVYVWRKMKKLDDGC